MERPRGCLDYIPSVIYLLLQYIVLFTYSMEEVFEPQMTIRLLLTNGMEL
jgi:hypothetical protein